MGIEAIWKDEAGGVLGEVGDPQFLLSRFTGMATSVQNSVCLRFLDPSGDACFNQLQIPILVQELRHAMRNVADPKLLAHLEKVLDLAERANAVHTYLWFMGD